MARKKSTKTEKVVVKEVESAVDEIADIVEEQKPIEATVNESNTIESLISSIQCEAKNVVEHKNAPVQHTNMKSFGYTWNGAEYDY